MSFFKFFGGSKSVKKTETMQNSESMPEFKKDLISRIKIESGYEGPITGFEQCKMCSGECCKKNACACLPEEFGETLTQSVITKLLDSKYYMITAVYRRAPQKSGIPIEAIPILSAREIDVPENGIFISMIHSKCANLGEKGCILNESQRPTQGLLLIPRDKDNCTCFVGVGKIIDQWIKYKEIMDEVIFSKTGKNCQELFEEVIFDEAQIVKKIVECSFIMDMPVNHSTYMAAKAMDLLGVFYGIYGEKIGTMMHDIVN